MAGIKAIPGALISPPVPVHEAPPQRGAVPPSLDGGAGGLGLVLATLLPGFQPGTHLYQRAYRLKQANY